MWLYFCSINTTGKDEDHDLHIRAQNTHDLYRDLDRAGRTNFTREGAKALMEYLQSLAEETDEAIEYDPVAWCCEFAEYENLEAFNKEGYAFKTLDDLRNNTTVIEFDDGLIVQTF